MSEPSSRAEAALRRALGVGLAVCLAGALVVLFVYGLAMVAFPHQVDYGEGVVLQQTDALTRGEALYRDPAVYPWRADPYAPLYVALCAALSPWLGVTLAAGRLVSWLSALGALLCVGLAASRRGGPLAGAAAAAFFLCSPLTVGWAAMYRVDFLGLFLETAGLLVVDGVLRRREAGADAGRAALLLGASLFALAFYTKQTFVLGLVASCIALFLVDRRRALELATAAGALIGVPFVGLQLWSGGRFFASLFTNNVMPWSWERAWPWVSQYARLSLLPLALAAWGAPLEPRRPRLWWIYLGLSALTLLGVGRVGAYYNHFLPFHAALAVVAGLGAARLVSSAPPSRAALAVALTLAQVAGLGVFGDLKPTLPSLARLSHQVARAADGRLQQQLREAQGELERDVRTLARYPGDVVAENMALPVLAGRPTVLCDPSTLFAMAQSGRWDEEAFVAAARAHRFGVVILQVPGAANLRFSPRALQAIADAYIDVDTVGGGDHVMVPRR